MKRIVTVISCIALIIVLCSCGTKTVEWNGKTECMAELFMITDFTNPYEYVGMVDYVFVGTVTETERLPLFCPTRAKTRKNGAFYGSRPAGNAGKSMGFRDSDR